MKVEPLSPISGLASVCLSVLFIHVMIFKQLVPQHSFPLLFSTTNFLIPNALVRDHILKNLELHKPHKLETIQMAKGVVTKCLFFSFLLHNVLTLGHLSHSLVYKNPTIFNLYLCMFPFQGNLRKPCMT